MLSSSSASSKIFFQSSLIRVSLAVVHGDQAGLGERVVAAQPVGQGDLDVPEQHGLGGLLPGTPTVCTVSCRASLSSAPIMQATVSTRVGSRTASCLTVTQCTSTTGAYMAG